MTTDVTAWLDAKREREPPVELSVRQWVELDTERAKQAERRAQMRREHKVSVYLHAETVAEVLEDARRHSRSPSASLQAAWRLARDKLALYPANPAVKEDSTDG